MTGTSPPTTFTPADDNLYAPVAHGSVWLVLAIAAAVLGAGLLVWCVKAIPASADAARAARLSVKERYLAEIDELQEHFTTGRIDERQLHHALSHMVRQFADEHGAPGALAMTPTELDGAGLVRVAGVVAGYQPPQFMERTVSDPPTSLAAARAVIRQW